ncbi:hypothetical protein AB0F43_24770 [Kribbella sp. NPDC023972]|uniref:amino acid kinase family protein n=1 Tax=Kribbella sp. NPDC023972 TaxID=3154795 RepID=UPI003411D972
MYRRLVLKLSGQAIAGPNEFGFNSDRLTHLANEVIAVRATGVQVAVVVGGGNVFRGNRAGDWGIDRVEADNIGMLGTVINAVLLRGRLSALGADDVRLMTAIPINNLSEPYIRLPAFILARDHNLPLHVFDIDQSAAASSIASGKHLGTLIN